MVARRSGSARRPRSRHRAGPACAASAANPTARTAGRMARPASANGAILARPPRPIPKHARTVCVNSAPDGAPPAEPRPVVGLVAEVVDAAARTARAAADGPRAGCAGVPLTTLPRRRGRPGRTGTPAAPACGRGRWHVVAEQVLEALAALLEPDERQPELGDRVADDVVLARPRRPRGGPSGRRPRPAAHGR